MQAHIGRTERGTYQLITMSHDNKIPHYYDLTDRQLADLVNQGTNNLNKKAYTTFVNLVKKPRCAAVRGAVEPNYLTNGGVVSRP